MTAFAGLAILHAAVAAALVEALVRVWRVSRPAERIVLRWMVLLAPLVLTPAYTLLAPFRAEPAFRLEWALFAGSHWDVLTILGVPVSLAATLALGVAGLLLFVRDVVPWFAAQVHPDTDEPARAGHDEQTSRLERVAAVAATTLGRPAPRLRLVARDVPVLLCTGVERPTIETSARTLDLLDDEALESALLHEMVHAFNRDPLHGWLLIVVRTLQCFNPVAHIVARLIVQDIEERADSVVVRLGHGPGLARAIAQLLAPDEHGVTDLRPQPAWRGAMARAEGQAVNHRRDRALRSAARGPASITRLRLLLASVGLAVLLFLVV